MMVKQLFVEKDLSKVEKWLKDRLMDEMLGYYCDGCQWCCYGYKFSQYFSC